MKTHSEQSTPVLDLEQLPELMTIDEAAAVLRISRASAYSAAHRGDLETVRIGRVFRVSRYALARMIGAPSSATTRKGPAANGTLTETSTDAHTESDHVVPQAY